MDLGVVQADDISHIRVFTNRVRQAKANTYVGENILGAQLFHRLAHYAVTEVAGSSQGNRK